MTAAIKCAMLRGPDSPPCGKPARRRIKGSADEGCCDDCAASLVAIGDYEPAELDEQYPLVGTIVDGELARAQAETKIHLKALTRVANGNRYPHGEMLSSAEMMRIARAALLDIRRKQPLVSIEAEVAAERALAERVPLWRELERIVRIGETTCGHDHYQGATPGLPDCDGCVTVDVMRKLAALDEKGTTDEG